MTMAIKILSCQADQVKLLQGVAIETFRQTYAQYNDPKNFEVYIATAFNESQLLKELQHPDSFYYLAIGQKNVLGYLKLNIGAAQTEEQVIPSLEIERIYVLRQFQGMGIGKLFLQKSIDQANSLTLNRIWLGVYELNKSALSFYQKQGFQVFGTHTFKLGSEDQKDYMMELIL